ncbi:MULTISPECIES: DUF1348 family protein [Nonomuraea]|uniref:DUF1348 family protein n=1 Tax=Nonomuraea mangrovi TaxID=2316207 RepID=A0ABW4SVE0_9ACTN
MFTPVPEDGERVGVDAKARGNPRRMADRRVGGNTKNRPNEYVDDAQPTGRFRKVHLIAQALMTPRCHRRAFALQETTKGMICMARPPLPPFTLENAIEKVRLAEDSWNTRDPERVAQGYTVDSHWRNRAEFLDGRDEIIAFLTRKWKRELEYRLIKELWAFKDDRIAVRFAYECRDDSGNWFRSYGNENWEFDEEGLMRVRHASINDLPIRESDRRYHWPLGRRPDGHPGLSDLGF